MPNLGQTRDSERGRYTPASALTEQVVQTFRDSSSPRYQAIMQSLVYHLHALIQEVGLTNEEWRKGIDFLTRTGHITDERRQEFILLSDVLGASMLTVAVNEPTNVGATESTVFGPFFLSQSPHVERGADLARGAAGEPCFVSGTVRGPSAEAIADARMEVWGADEDGLYDVQRPSGNIANRGHLFTDDRGNFSFWTIRPTAYPIPGDGPVGDLLRAAGRGAMRPAHLHFMISAPGWRTLVTHIFAAGDPYLDHDAVFGVKESLVAEYVEHQADEMAPGRAVGRPWATLSYDFVLVPSATGTEADAPGPA
ncbi:MAG TPA: dioxygenase [Candidatus Dormibacteraeota bacterium]|nr:dioxygenase [Candidatus Dormibacteraeota bacterium]